MKLGYCVPEFPSQTHIFFWREVVSLRRMGVEVHLISTRRPGSDICRHEFAEEAARETHYVFPPQWGAALAALGLRPQGLLRCLAYVTGLRQTPLKGRLIKMGLILTAADLLVHSRRLGLDHIHVHSCAEAAHVAALCSLLGGPPFSLTLHGDLPVYGVDHDRKMARACFIACDAAPLTRQITAATGIGMERLAVLWNGVDTDRFHDAGLRSSQPGRLHMVTVARLNATKGHRHSLAALRQALDAGCDIHYTLAGEGPYQKEIEAEIQRLNLQDRVVMMGTRSEGEVIQLLQQADVFVLPSIGLGEAAPVSVMEAMSCGLPVICSIIGGTPDMMTNGVDGLLIAQGDEQGIAEALIRLAQDPEERIRLGRNARARAVQNYDSRKTAHALLEMIRKFSPGGGS